MARIVSEEKLPVRQCIPKAEVKCFATVHLPIRQLVEFLLRTGSIDSRFTGFDRALEGARIHRKLQKAAGEGYQPLRCFSPNSRQVRRHPFYP